MLDKDTILTWLEEVKDPEIPVLSLVDLGVITQIEINNNQHVVVEMTPTFVGCPALDVMKNEIVATLQRRGITNATVNVTFREPWTSDRISEKGKAALKKFGIAPPAAASVFTDLEILEDARCPRCDGLNTTLKNPFGPALCRAIYYCQDCQEAFEQFKPL